MSVFDLLNYGKLQGGEANGAVASDTGDLAAQLNYIIERLKEIVGTVDVSPTESATGSLAERIAYIQTNSTGARKVSGSGYQVAPSAANGIDPSMANSWGAGSWSEIIASTSAAIFIVGFTCGMEITSSNTGDEFEVDIGTGTAASETRVATFPLAAHAASATVANAPATIYTLPFPIAVATSTRVAVRARRKSNGGSVVSIKLLYVNQSELAPV